MSEVYRQAMALTKGGLIEYLKKISVLNVPKTDGRLAEKIVSIESDDDNNRADDKEKVTKVEFIQSNKKVRTSCGMSVSSVNMSTALSKENSNACDQQHDEHR